jgi:pyrroline-5-carboxylate reductase
MMNVEGPIWLVGCGNMGGALLDRWLACGLDPQQVTIIDPQAAPRAGVRMVATPAEAGGPPVLVILAVKPQFLDSVAPDLAACLRPTTLLVSVLAGTRLASLSRHFDVQVVRAMPNTPARIGRGATALYGNVPAPAKAVAETLMAAAGSVHWVDDEALFDAVTGVSGSGPAYLFRFIEALESAAVAAGLPAELAAALALETVAGAAALAAGSGVPPAELRRQVTSPNGTTQAGLNVLDGEGELTRLLTATVAAATTRSRELAAASA